MRAAQILFLLFFASTMLCGQGQWEFRKEKDGIKAYTRNIEDSKFDEYKVETTMQGSLTSIVAVLQDMDIYKDIFNDTEEVEVISSIGDHDFDIYSHTGTPWPAKDRNSYSKTIYSYDKASKTVDISIDCEDNEYLKSKQGPINVTKCNGSWKIADQGDGTIHIIHRFHVNPEGNVPAWLINKKTVDSPIKSLQKIKKYISKPAYQGRTYKFMQD